MTLTLSALKRLDNTPPWDWPEDTGTALIEVLRDRRAGEIAHILATDEVRRRILEASGPAPLDWHPDATRVAHAGDDDA